MDVVTCMEYMHFMVSATSLPPILGGGGGGVGRGGEFPEILGWFIKGGADKICCFRVGTQNLREQLWPSRWPCIWKISYPLHDNLYDGYIRFGMTIFENVKSFEILR